ncbi:ketopantoate reductase family protein [Alkalibacillus salilacus]|uniref:2-dehydropantoate 2-reductase n=1 Tax=Alkalibacillus salilacus TaxID=284582 RepID=A0ABT9VE00_9BACI|nr:2-dehydropantoate 2-reductase [Alkalibacillus salilacus]MDQ0159192.1 2-dehydropantoate 2-reductase [Alkalibacillus salilacus]
MSVGVIGIGAVGLFVAHELSQMRYSVTCYVKREDQKATLEREGIQKDDQTPVYPNVQMIHSLQAHDWLFVCTKQTDLDNVVKQIDQTNDKINRVVFLQNGLGHVEKIKDLKGLQKFIGVLEHGVKRVNDHHVLHTGRGLIRLAPLNHTKTSSLNHLNHDHFPIIIEDSLQKTLEEKLVINSVINPLTAIYGVKNGTILEVDRLRRLAHQLLLEATEILELDDRVMWGRVESVCRNTSENTSSMLADINRGRQTEIDYMNGYLVRIALEKCPTHELIYQMIKVKECLSEV